MQQQIEQGAATDVFISASPKYMEALENKDLVLMDTKVNLLKNKVVLIVPAENTTINSFDALVTDAVNTVGMGDPGSTPLGVYGTDVLNFYNIYNGVADKLVLAKDVREVVSWVETKNADAGFVFETDAKDKAGIRVAAVAPEESHKPVLYPAAVLKNNGNEDGAKEFLQFLQGERAKTVFEKYGFTTVNN